MASWLPEFSGLHEYEIDSVVQFIRNNRENNSTFEETAGMKGNSKNGQTIYDSNCIICHGHNGEGSIAINLNNRDFLRTASDRFLYQTIRNGRYNTAMPSWSWMNNNEMVDQIRGKRFQASCICEYD
jgi:hypothetical protein